MKCTLRWLLLAGMAAFALLSPGAQAATSSAASGKVLKVLPHYLDLKGRHSLSPSLYDRDAYQALLRERPAERSGLRFDVQYRVARATQPRLQVEVRAMKAGQPQTKVLEIPLKKSTFLGRWASLAFKDADYQELGEISAWRVTLWDGGTLLGERKSFLWPPDSAALPATGQRKP